VLQFQDVTIYKLKVLFSFDVGVVDRRSKA
jgi:hypothetical protein